LDERGRRESVIATRESRDEFECFARLIATQSGMKLLFKLEMKILWQKSARRRRRWRRKAVGRKHNDSLSAIFGIFWQSQKSCQSFIFIDSPEKRWRKKGGGG